MYLITSFWGKAQPKDDLPQTWHPLLYHILDVAAVAEVMLRQDSIRLGVLAKAMGFREPQQALSLIVFITAIHDVGKFMPQFQLLRKDLFQQLQNRDPKSVDHLSQRHDATGFALLEGHFHRRFLEHGQAQLPQPNETLQDFIDQLFCATTGHHGKPTRDADVAICDYCPEQDLQAIQAFLDDALQRFQPSFAGWCNPPTEAWSFLLNGFITFCDWLGSHQSFFPYTPPDHDLDCYWDIALDRAEVAIRNTGLMSAKATPNTGFAALFDPTWQPTQLQETVSNISFERGPKLFMVEDLTGSGKTEATLILAHRLMQAGEANGFYFALPTMATADQMYDRVRDAFAKLFQDQGDLISLVLAQGQRQLNQQFTQTLQIESAVVADPTYGDEAPGQRDGTASAACTTWLSDRAKCSLLATVGVGTVDQAMLAVMCNKHFPLRLYGLAGKVLIIDEAHCYDAYMTTIIRKLIYCHALLGGSVILLSATMPSKMRHELTKSFYEALRIASGQALNMPADDLASNRADSYPCLWQYNAYAQTKNFIPLQAKQPRKVQIHFVEVDPIQQILQLLAQGHCVCWIRNTIHDAIDAFDCFEQHLPAKKLTLFHARFAMVDRLAIQNHLLQDFGKDSTAAQRSGRLVIATQVVEQSLDIDFDFVFSDLAPMDLIIQRMGRQMRHLRDAKGNRIQNPKANQRDGRGTPVFHIVAPAFLETHDPALSEDWYKQRFERASYVYRYVGLLWLTQKLLQERGAIELPGDIRALIEGAYDFDAVPQPLLANQDHEWGKGRSAASTANGLTCDFAQGYSFTSVLSGEEVGRTRDGDETQTFRLFLQDQGALRCYATGKHAEHLSQVRKQIYGEMTPVHDPQEHAELKALAASFPDKNHGVVPVILKPDDANRYHSQLHVKDKDTLINLYYCKRKGLVIEMASS